MEVEGVRRTAPWGRIVVIIVVLIAIALLWFSIDRARRDPSTNDASIDAEVVHIAAGVGGEIVQLPVKENALVRKGELLFQIDPVPYRAAVAQAEADLAIARASLGSKGRVVSSQRSTATVADEQVRRAEANRALAQRTVERLRPLAAQNYIPRQQLDQAEVSLRDATTSLVQAKEQQAGTRNAIDNTDDAIAGVQAREAALIQAKHALEQATVRAPQTGRVVGLTVLTGERVAPGQSLFTLVASEEWHAVGNFRETALKHIKVGDCATVYSLIDRGRPISGVVDGIGAGVADAGRINIPRSVPYVEKSLNWVRVAQRFPVRVRLQSPPEDLVRLGASAVVEIRHGAGCRR